jgi:hypothetical protein
MNDEVQLFYSNIFGVNFVNKNATDLFEERKRRKEKEKNAIGDRHKCTRHTETPN